MKVALLTREYPPEVYGGAGVHIEYLARALAAGSSDLDIAVHCFGSDRSDPLVARAYSPWSALEGDAPDLAALRTLSVDLLMADGARGSDVVHSHTWYANMAGHLASLVHGIPHVATTHSLEPLRPWKAEQLGGGYAVTSWCERTALEAAAGIIAVSAGMRDDVLACYPAIDPERVHVIHNGIDTLEYRRVASVGVLERLGLTPGFVLFVGRITRQKGLAHMLDAASLLDPSVQVVLCAGAADTPEIEAEVAARVAELPSVTWLSDVLARSEVIELLSHCGVFACPSIYEPFGLVNVEAMACGAPVVASAVGGIPEIVVPGLTGLLVPFEAGSDAYGSPADPAGFAADLAGALSSLLADPAQAAAMGASGRARVEQHFAWPAIAARTADLYRSLT